MDVAKFWIPDEFDFVSLASLVNECVDGWTYHAKRDGDHYTVTLLGYGVEWNVPVDKMKELARDYNFAIYTTK